MNMIAAQPSIATAPRDAGALAVMGRYQLIRLAEQLGLAPTAERRAALKSAPINEFVSSLLLALQEYDAKNPQVAPVVASIAPVASEPVPEAAPTPAPAPKKEPRTRAQVAAATAAAAAATPAPQPANALTDELVQVLAGIRCEVHDALTANKKLEQRLADFEEKITHLTRLNQWQFSLLSMVAQQHIRATADELILDAVQDCDAMLAILNKANAAVTAPTDKKSGKGA